MSEIILDSVGLELPIYNQHALSIFSKLKSFSSNSRINAINKTVLVKAIQEMSLSIKDGDRLGLVGRNGAGKTTLLRVMAGIYKPTKGHVYTSGKISCLLGTGFGMDDDATGYENIFLSGIYIGIKPTEMKKKVDDIIDFSELGDFIHLPMRTYSAGMKARLSFAIATSYTPEILLIDEGIGAGDAAFFNKAQKRLKSFMNNSRILVLASHANELIKTFCNKAIYLDNGVKKGEGEPNTVIEQYLGDI